MASEGATLPERSASLYLWILAAWLCLVACAVPAFVVTGQTAVVHGPLAEALVWTCSVFVCYFWLNGTKDIVYVAYFRRHHRALLQGRAATAPRAAAAPSVLLLYCTCDDFDPTSLRTSMQQTVPCRTVILDDSRQPDSRAAVDRFAERYDVAVSRRRDWKGFKAGNLNHFLKVAEFDYFVLLDSDELIPSDFVARALPYFEDQTVGIVQANHASSRAVNPFMRRFSPGIDSHWPTYQSVKQRFGFLSLLGHGAMVSATCYRAAGGFPEMVAEDLAFSIEARLAGFRTVFAAEITCHESFPVSYAAFKKRHTKWTAGNLQFIRLCTGQVLLGSLSWYEKLDIVLFTYSLPLTVLFVGYILINVVALPLIGVRLHYPLWLLLPTVLFLGAPLLNDIIHYWRLWSVRRLLGYCASSFALYGSMFGTSVWATAMTLVKGANFVVTPKVSAEVGWWEAIRFNWRELGLATGLVVLSQVFARSVLPCALLLLAASATPYLTLLSNGGGAPDLSQPAPGALGR